MIRDKFPIIFTVFGVSLSYFIGSVFLKGSQFYLFDCMWRIVIVTGVLIFGHFNPRISLKQILLLLTLFGIEGFVYFFFSTKSLYQIAISVVFAPILEEVLFRGWVMDKIDGSNKDKILFSSLLFGLYHLKNARVLTVGALLYQIAYAGLFIGPILAWLRLRTGSIFAGIVIHSGNNMVADLVTPHLIPFIAKKREDFK